MLSLYDKILQEATLFELLETEAYSETDKALRLALQSINNKILSYPDDNWTKKRLKELRALVVDEITKAYGGLFSTLTVEQTAIAALVASNIVTNLNVPIAVIDEITSPTRLVQGYTQKDLFKATEANHARQLNVIIGAGVTQGKSTTQIVSDLNTKNGKLTRGQLNNAIFTSVTEARAIARYKAFEELEKSGVTEGYEYVSVLDSRTTEYCRNHDNRKYYKPIGEITHLINTHWHCRSVFVPFTKTTKVLTRASEIGEIPNESYSVWFAKQDSTFQKQTLGSKYKDYIKGAYKIGGLPDIKNTKTKLKLNQISL